MSLPRRPRRRLGLAVLLFAACVPAVAACGGGEGVPGFGGAGIVPVPLDFDVRCSEGTEPGCSQEFPPGTRFYFDHDGRKWKIRHVSTRTNRGVYPDENNPEWVQVEPTFEFELESGEPEDIANEDGFFTVDGTMTEDKQDMGKCGQKPETGTIRPGQKLTVSYCLRTAGPPHLLRAPLKVLIGTNYSQKSTGATINIEDVPGPSGESVEGGLPDDAPDAPDTYKPPPGGEE